MKCSLRFLFSLFEVEFSAKFVSIGRGLAKLPEVRLLDFVKIAVELEEEEEKGAGGLGSEGFFAFEMKAETTARFVFFLDGEIFGRSLLFGLDMIILWVETYNSEML